MSYTAAENVKKKLSFVFVVERKPDFYKKVDKSLEVDSRGNYVVNGSFRNTGRCFIEEVGKVLPSYLVVLQLWEFNIE